MEEEEIRAGAEAVITAYGIPLAPVTSFKYLRRVLSEADNNWIAVVSNLRKVWRKWARITRVLSREGADVQTLGRIYVAVIQAVPLYGSETWVLTPCFGEILVRFHHRLARRLK